MITRTLLVSSVIAVAGLGLIGVGSNAVFTQDTVSSQQITAGTMNVVISAAGHEGSTVALPAVGPTNSSFATAVTKVTITNKGNIAVQEIFSTPGVEAGGDSASQALKAQVYLCEVSFDPAQNADVVIYNGLLSAAKQQGIQGTLAPLATDNYTATYYAGDVTTPCGIVMGGTNALAASGKSLSPSLTNAAQAGVITPTMTVSYTG